MPRYDLITKKRYGHQIKKDVLHEKIANISCLLKMMHPCYIGSEFGNEINMSLRCMTYFTTFTLFKAANFINTVR